MADNGLLHTTELLKTALPYVDVRSKLTLDLLLKSFELMVSLRNFRSNNIAACGFDEKEKADMEDLLNKIRPKCNDYEAGFVDKLLNVFKAKKMFEMYNSYMEVMNTMQGFQDFQGFGKGGMDSDTVSNFMNSFSGFDFSGMDLSAIFGGVNKDADNNESAFDSSSDITKDDIGLDSEDISDNGDISEYQDISDCENILSNEENLSSDESNDNNSDDYDHTQMFESLKSMITPDQMGAFENLRMLFGSPSYDDNSNKSDENKE
ncbi:MAG: hypothetical protein GX237_01555 [Clostridiales bacterium]|nr:hypothetical protein [Clostridiales bacterium]